MSDAYANGTDVPSVPRSVCQECERLRALLREANAFIGREPTSIAEQIQVLTPLCNRIDAALAADQPKLATDDAVDAARYRWLRGRIPVTAIHCREDQIMTFPADQINEPSDESYCADVDAAIDAAMTADKSTACVCAEPRLDYTKGNCTVCGGVFQG